MKFQQDVLALITVSAFTINPKGQTDRQTDRQTQIHTHARARTHCFRNYRCRTIHVIDSCVEVF
jgi:hypothetical protein